jgi:DHA1 family bicyclomycin/chloramphenicol resistance-like MFS transporter
MARTMSFVMAVFILVPVLAPTLGAGLSAVAPWQTLFWLCVGYVAVIAVWTMRLPETLHAEHRLELRFDGIVRAARIVFGNRRTMAYTGAITVTFAALVSYLATSELIVEDVFGLGDRFPLVFGGLAAVMGVAMLTNASLVERLGARRMVSWLLWGYLGAATVLAALSIAGGGAPPFWAFVLPLAAVLVMNAFLFPNLNTLALEPMGEVAGTAAAIIGTIQTGGGALLGSFIDRAYDGSTTPLAVGFVLAGMLAFIGVRWGAPDDR